MLLIATFIKTIVEIVSMFIGVYMFVIIIGALISWVRPSGDMPMVQIIYKLTQPVYDFIKRYIRTSFNGFDFAPIIVLLVLQFIDNFFLVLIKEFALNLLR